MSRTQIVKQENVSTVFLLPATGISIKMRDFFYKFGFVNTYIHCDIEYGYPCLHIMFQPEKFDQGTIGFFSELEKEKNYIESFDLLDNKVLFIFRIPKKFTKDYDTFIKGKYSRFTKGFMDLFPKEVYVYDPKGKPVKNGFGSYLREPSQFYHIFNRTEHLKQRWADKLGIDLGMFTEEDELYTIQDIDKETINILITDYIY